MTTVKLNLKTSELLTGDVVFNHGMHVRIDSTRKVDSPKSYQGFFHVCAGTVINLDEVREAEIIPMSWLQTQKFVEGTGWTIDRRDQWTIQGNDLATWSVERTA